MGSKTNRVYCRQYESWLCGPLSEHIFETEFQIKMKPLRPMQGRFKIPDTIRALNVVCQLVNTQCCVFGVLMVKPLKNRSTWSDHTKPYRVTLASAIVSDLSRSTVEKQQEVGSYLSPLDWYVPLSEESQRLKSRLRINGIRILTSALMLSSRQWRLWKNPYKYFLIICINIFGMFVMIVDVTSSKTITNKKPAI